MHRPGWCSVCRSPLSQSLYISTQHVAQVIMLLTTATCARDPHHSPSLFLSHSPAAFSSTPHHHTTSPLPARFITGFLVPHNSCTALSPQTTRFFENVAAPCAVVGCRVAPPGYSAVPGSITGGHGANISLVIRQRWLRCLRLPAQRTGTLQWQPVRSRRWWPR